MSGDIVTVRVRGIPVQDVFARLGGMGRDRPVRAAAVYDVFRLAEALDEMRTLACTCGRSIDDPCGVCELYKRAWKEAEANP